MDSIIGTIEQRDTSDHKSIFLHISINLGSGIMPSSYIWSITFSELFPFYHFSQQPAFLVLKVLRLLSSDKWWCMYTQFSTFLLEFNSLGNATALRYQTLCFFGFGIREGRHPALIWGFNTWFGSIFWLSQAHREDKSLDMRLVL